MKLYERIWDKINASGVSISRSDNQTIVRCNDSFKALPLTVQKSINDSIENELKRNAFKVNPELKTAADVRKDIAMGGLPFVLDQYKGSPEAIRKVKDMMPGMGMHPSFSYQGNGMGGTGNIVTGSGIYGMDPSRATRSVPNVWISPYEANSIYSQKGIPELIIRKKSQSILLNGVRVKNKYYTPEQLDKITENIIKHNVPDEIATATNWSLIYGGSLIYPMFKKDTPLSLSMDMGTLLKYGILGKNCVDRFVTLDRWNTIHIPQWNPTQADFLKPKKYFIPFLGCDVSGERCGRIITAPQAGYWGNIMTMGWGLSDMCGWYASVLNYMTVMDTIPTMINQMSILARTINVDGPMATEGELILDELSKQNTIRVRESSTINDPITLDVIGTLQAIQRDFSDVPDLVRLIRQDFCARANIPEELILSSERGAFSSGDTTEGALEKQWESIKYIHKDVAKQLRNILYILVIDALGVDRDVMKYLPYTEIEFDNPALTDASKIGQFYKDITEGYFNDVSGLMPADMALRVTAQVAGTDLPIDNEIIEELKNRQSKLDAQADEKHELEMELLRQQIENLKNPPMPAGGGAPGAKAPAKPKDDSDSKGHSYSNKLEQKQHEKVSSSGKSFQRLQKAVK